MRCDRKCIAMHVIMYIMESKTIIMHLQECLAAKIKNRSPAGHIEQSEDYSKSLTRLHWTPKRTLELRKITSLSSMLSDWISLAVNHNLGVSMVRSDQQNISVVLTRLLEITNGFVWSE